MGEASEYVKEEFRKISGEKRVYTHFTTATDTKNVDRVFESCMDVVMKENVENMGFVWLCRVFQMDIRIQIVHPST